MFLSVHWFGIRSEGSSATCGTICRPTPILLPFHIISEITRTVALAVRLFGNMMSLEMAALLVLLVAGLLVPVPLLMLHIVEALVQAYIFGMLALIYIAGACNPRSTATIEQEEERHMNDMTWFTIAFDRGRGPGHRHRRHVPGAGDGRGHQPGAGCAGAPAGGGELHHCARCSSVWR